jgi:hypothetical protein
VTADLGPSKGWQSLCYFGNQAMDIQTRQAKAPQVAMIDGRQPEW